MIFSLGSPCIGGVGTTSHPAASPLPVQRLQLEEFNGGGGSPMSQRSGFMRRESHVLADISEVDTLDSTAMTDQAVHNISAMFPTVEESHIKDLLKKYVFFLREINFTNKIYSKYLDYKLLKIGLIRISFFFQVS